MFVFTAKITKKRAIAGILCLAVILAAVVVTAGLINRSPDRGSAKTLLAGNNEERVRFLKSYGWEVEATPLEEQTVVIPREFGDVYQEYNRLQIKQGFDLTQYAGVECVRYTYKILNFPNSNVTAVADIIVYRGVVIAGDVQSNALDGFMMTLTGEN